MGLQFTVATPRKGVPEKMPWEKYLPLAAALAVISGNNKIIYQDILTALADATNDQPMPCHEQRPGL